MKNWTFSRYFRLVAGIGIAIYAIHINDYSLLLLTALLFAQAIFNFGCCGSSCGGGGNKKSAYDIKPYRGTGK